MTVGFVGLGIMGGAMAANLLEAGEEVVGFDPNANAAGRFQARGGELVESPAAVAARVEIVLTSIAAADHFHAAVGGDQGLAARARRGLLVVETSTLALSDKEAARDLLLSKGAEMIDSPISGTGAQAEARDLVFLMSGEQEAMRRARPVLERLGRSVVEVGPFGAGSKLKFVANLLVAINNVATAEALVLAARAGLDLHLVLDTLDNSAATSRIFQLRGPLMADGRYEPPTARISMFAKDLALISEFASSLEAPTPLLAASGPIYEEAMEKGMSNLDGAAVHLVLAERAGLARRT